MDELKPRFYNWLKTEDGRRFCKLVFTLTGGDQQKAIALSQILFWRLEEGIAYAKSLEGGNNFGERGSTLLNEVLGERLPKVIPKGYANRSAGRTFKASFIYFEQAFELPQDAGIVTIPFLFEQYTGTLYAKKTVNFTSKARMYFIRDAIQSLQALKVSRGHKYWSIQKLYVPERILTDEPELKTKITAVAQKVNLPLAAGFQLSQIDTSLENSPTVITLKQDSETVLMRCLADWIKLVNEQAIQQTAKKISSAKWCSGINVSVRELLL